MAPFTSVNLHSCAKAFVSCSWRLVCTQKFIKTPNLYRYRGIRNQCKWVNKPSEMQMLTAASGRWFYKMYKECI